MYLFFKHVIMIHLYCFLYFIYMNFFKKIKKYLFLNNICVTLHTSFFCLFLFKKFYVSFLLSFSLIKSNFSNQIH